MVLVKLKLITTIGFNHVSHQLRKVISNQLLFILSYRITFGYWRMSYILVQMLNDTIIVVDNIDEKLEKMDKKKKNHPCFLSNT